MIGRTNAKQNIRFSTDVPRVLYYKNERNIGAENWVQTISVTKNRYYALVLVAERADQNYNAPSFTIEDGADTLISNVLGTANGYLLIAKATADTMTFRFKKSGANGNFIQFTACIELPQYTDYVSVRTSVNNKPTFTLPDEAVGKTCTVCDFSNTNFTAGTVGAGSATLKLNLANGKLLNNTADIVFDTIKDTQVTLNPVEGYIKQYVLIY